MLSDHISAFFPFAEYDGEEDMSFQEFCHNGSFLDPDFNGTIKGILVTPEYYTNQLNRVQRTSLGILFFLVATVAIVGNGLGLLTVYRRKLQVLYKCCVVSQCAGDLLMAVFVGINSLSNFVHDTIDWKFGGFMCGWMPQVTTMCALLSSMIITCIAIDRYQGVVLLSGKWEPKFTTSVLVLGCLWAVAAGTTVPTFLSYNLKPACFINFGSNSSKYVHLCVTNKMINSQYFLSIFGLIFLPLLAAFVVTYVVIARLVWAKKQGGKGQESGGSASTLNTSLDSHGAAPEGRQVPQTPTRAAQQQKKLRTFSIVLVIMATFIVCRLPQWIFLVVTTFPRYRVTGNFWWTVKYLLSALSLSNAAINPFIYPFLNDMVHLKSNLKSGLQNLKNLKLKNIRMNLVSSSGGK